MPNADFIHLRVHSAYSLSEGAIKLKELVKLCVKQRMPAVAVTDTGNLFGALEFALAAMDVGVQPVIGTVLGITRVVPADAKPGLPGKPPAPDQLVLLCQNETGYRNLMALVSKAFLESDPMAGPQVTMDALEGRSDGLIALTGGPGGSVGRLLGEGQKDLAVETLGTLKRLFPGRLYVELQRHSGAFAAIEDAIEPALIDLAYAHDLPLVATNDCYFADEGMYAAHDALLCIAEGAYLSQDERRRLTPDHRFKSAEEMRLLFADLPEAVDNTVVIARRCSFLLKPIKPILPAFPTEAGRSEAEELRAQARDGLAYRLEKSVFTPAMTDAEKDEARKTYGERLEFELDVIERMKFPGYFLIVSDFIKWAKQQGIPVGPGRGSGAGSVVAWSLLITDLDPLRFGLLFERFLNPERVSMPDFDIDFCQDRREEVIRYVQDKYGYDRVAQIITFGKLQARAVLRDVGRVLQMPYGQVDKICKMVPNNPANPVTLQQAIDSEPMLQAARDGDETVKRLIDVALKLEGLYRHASTHAAGVVIGDRPLDQLVPLYRDPRSDMPVTQFNMKYVEQAGLVKFDFLGLKTLTVLQTAVNLIPDPPDLTNLPLEDERSYAILGRAESTGVFQLESSGMRDVLKRLKPNRLEDIIALVSLYRPGPMDNIPKYIKVKNGEEKPDYMHDSLEPILKETFGIMIYQEQVMQIAQVLSGYSLGGADLLRRAMGKKIKEEMDAQRKIFVDGATGRGVDGDQASLIFDQVMKFAGYGFNKSHAAAYALVAFQTAYLKANHPVEFMAASMTLDLGNTDKLNVFRQELTRLKIRLLTPDINRSESIFAVEAVGDGEKAIRYALAAVKGVGLAAMKTLVEERRKNGPFRSLFDFARRMDLKTINKRQLENLACAGAFDGINPNRAQVHAALETLIRYAQAAAAERDSGMGNLFGGSGEGLKEPKLPQIADWEPLVKLKHEFGAIGFYLSAHPLDAFSGPLSRMKVLRSAELQTAMARGGSTRYRMAGIVINRQERTAKSGNRFAFVALSDASGVYEVTCFAETLASSRELLEAGRAVLLSVDAQLNGEEVRLTCNEVKPLDEAVASVSEGLRVVVRDAAPLPHLKAMLDRFGRGKGRIHLLVEMDALREAEIQLPGGYSFTAQSRAALKSVSGVIEVAEL
ncbi:DNA polymerase III subunit alpha [Azospirillum sp. RWY-5-1]|uniref:DNA polymerase III subunit alpha n=1 Tax=Azospirillum oleiclasticum TaxID=2735135 RepID=A0ABX2T7Z8_9PROT|nr:DNA polymerase III subunit alpha [Azospirillum oleiclasticum]NYZ12211.1 DNA polymerase III subunit alpha [Azospirillum oleiclasticum]NYZ19371.1 DNA polymerase III subunit alpha [Azospirillum oleiclasticum]